MIRKMALVAAVMTAGATMADEGPWTAKAGLGYLGTSGNSETVNVNGVFDLGYKIGRWEHGLNLLAIGAEADSQSTAERYGLGYKAKWNIRDYDYAFGNINYDKDKFSGVEQSLSETVGYGRRIWNTPVHVLNAEAGIGFRQQDFLDGTSANGAIVRLGGDYLYNFNDVASFTQVLVFEIGDDNTSTLATSGLNTKLRDQLALVLGYTIKNNSDVPAGVDKTDTFTSINLEYTF